jgi:hypothetical protein
VLACVSACVRNRQARFKLRKKRRTGLRPTPLPGWVPTACVSISNGSTLSLCRPSKCTSSQCRRCVVPRNCLTLSAILFIRKTQSKVALNECAPLGESFEQNFRPQGDSNHLPENSRIGRGSIAIIEQEPRETGAFPLGNTNPMRSPRAADFHLCPPFAIAITRKLSPNPNSNVLSC